MTVAIVPVILCKDSLDGTHYANAKGWAPNSYHLAWTTSHLRGMLLASRPVHMTGAQDHWLLDDAKARGWDGTLA